MGKDNQQTLIPTFLLESSGKSLNLIITNMFQPAIINNLKRNGKK
jgi:hypothetical protein